MPSRIISLTRKPATILFGLFMLVLFALAVFPEKPAAPLTNLINWEFEGTQSNRVPLQSIPTQFLNTRRSVAELPGNFIYRTWTPENGILPLKLQSPAFFPSEYMSIPITGNNLTTKGLVHTYLVCGINGKRIEIFRGSVNVNVNESIVSPPTGWCPGTAKLFFESTEQGENVGVGGVFKISRLSYLKQSFLGRLPYFFVAIFIFSYVMLAGSSFITAKYPQIPHVPAAFAALGIFSLLIFYLYSFVSIGQFSRNIQVLSSLGVFTLAITLHIAAGAAVRLRAWSQLLPYGQAWFWGSLICFSLGNLGYNGLGHWEANYQFWPAIWSSDNELPWLFAEALRNHWDLKGLFGGGWLPTDRPPLMVGAHLLLSDTFGLIQANNDGYYLRGALYNIAAILLGSLWVPAILWVMTTFATWLNKKDRTSVIVFTLCIPFIFFNTLYGWPKAYGAAFAIIAFGLAWNLSHRNSACPASLVICFFIISAWSLLSHMSGAIFLLPLIFFFLLRNHRRSFASILIGIVCFTLLLASWSLYKLLVLPSTDPVTKYALAGDFGFSNPSQSLLSLIIARYNEFSFGQWLDVKKSMLLQAFLPVHNQVTQINLNTDYGANFIDKLRSWDFMLLSKGNITLLFFTLITAWIYFNSLLNQKHLSALKPFILITLVSISAWLLVVFLFLAPPILHVWPQAAIFGLMLGGAIIVLSIYPRVFYSTLLLQIIYFITVWIISPLTNALALDFGAIFLSTGLLVFAIYKQSIFHRESVFSSSSRIEINNRPNFKPLIKNDRLIKLAQLSIWEKSLRAISIGVFLYSTFIAARYINQPLIDVHAFRQTQTALTSYWMIKEGLTLAYQTPVMGYPWSVPFEFPIYQAIVASLTTLTGLSLDSVGRAVSYIFLIACAWPGFAISKQLKLPKQVPWVFVSLLWSAPLNVYWGRTFMIETAALFFAFACLHFSIDIIKRQDTWRNVWLYWIMASAAVLQKSTTGGPVLLFIELLVVISYLRQGSYIKNIFSFARAASIIGAPLLAGLAWAYYADVIKLQNPMGRQLISQTLLHWNFGTAAQKLSPDTWALVVWERCFTWNAAGIFGLCLLLLPWIFKSPTPIYRRLSLATLTLFILPIVIFTNVHIVHEYYQVACISFLLAALALTIGGWLTEKLGHAALAPVLTLIIVVSNFSVFSHSYGVVTARQLDNQDPRSVQAYKVGQYLRTHTKEGSALAIFGQDYSSEIAYQAQRKSMTAPEWFKSYHDIWQNPDAYIGTLQLGAIVICPSPQPFPSGDDIQKKIMSDSRWQLTDVHGCQLLIPTVDSDRDTIRE